ncbi:MAG: hypothetical protein RRA94_04020 [Bacteroidota bacterium]|nr:hypothetical protein [Bacteroidota bacterium]
MTRTTFRLILTAVSLVLFASITDAQIAPGSCIEFVTDDHGTIVAIADTCRQDTIRIGAASAGGPWVFRQGGGVSLSLLPGADYTVVDTLIASADTVIFEGDTVIVASDTTFVTRMVHVPDTVEFSSRPASQAVDRLYMRTVRLRPRMHHVVSPLFDRSNARRMTGIFDSLQLIRIEGHIWIESHLTGLREHYYVDLVPDSGTYVPVEDGSLVGYSVGFGLYGQERRRFRCDTYEYRDSGDSQFASESAELHRSAKWISTADAISETMLQEYFDTVADSPGTGIRLIMELVVYAR